VYFKTKSLPAVCPYVCLDLYNYQTDFEAAFLKDSLNQKKGLYVYNIHNIMEKDVKNYLIC
jgi:hypothetical protein